MHRSSDSIGAIATALAKAQTELTNPEKSLIGTVQPSAPGERERSFRYAPLSSGLEIVRKSLGRHEIATVQTTAIDKEAGLVRLTTVLAHSSGEWVSSDWPICPVSDVATPHRLGAALTYARRYALFTLVGIAGEDDLDAPDLSISPTVSETPRTPSAAPESGQNGRAPVPPPPRAVKTGHSGRVDQPTHGPELVANTYELLIAELSALSSEELLLAWATRVLPIKNALSVDDARSLEQAFEQKIAFRTPTADVHPAGSAVVGVEPREPNTIEKEDDPAFPIPKTPRLRDKKHLAYVATRPCLACGRTPSDPHHLKFTQPRALGRKVSDEFTLCRAHHRELHDNADETEWWARNRIDPLPIARQLWQATR